MSEWGGALVLAGVGHGKTLIGLLALRALQGRRAVLLVQNGLRTQVLEEARHFAEHVELPPVFDAREMVEVHDSAVGVFVAQYSDLSSQRHADLLDRIRPDVLVEDEAHNLKDPKSARTRRRTRYLRENPGTRVVDMSGTVTSKRPRDFAHLAEACLGSRSPVPSYRRAWYELCHWDELLQVRRPGEPAPPPEREGVLALLCQDGDEPLREAFRRRLVETPGVVSTTAQSCDASIVLERTAYTPSPKLASEIAHVRQTWTNGDEIIDSPARLAQVLRALSCGYRYRWEWPGGRRDEEWLAARGAWARRVCEELRRSGAGYDSPGFVEAAHERGERSCPEWDAWSAIRDRVKPEPVCELISASYVKDCAEEIQARRGAWLVFTAIPELGRHLATLLDAEYFGEGEADAERLTELARSPEAGKRTIVLSIQSHSTGRNLQAWSRVALAGSAGGKLWEQAIGRAHRQGQEADVVEVLALGAAHVDYHQGGRLDPEGRPTHAEDFERALEDARYVHETTGQAQCLLLATVAV
jgi:hypothetical protein